MNYYYVMPHGKPDFSKVGGPVLGHFGTADDFVPVDDAKALEREIADASGQDVNFEFYEGAGHAFFNDTRPEVHDAEESAKAWASVVPFLKANIT